MRRRQCCSGGGAAECGDGLASALVRRADLRRLPRPHAGAEATPRATCSAWRCRGTAPPIPVYLDRLAWCTCCDDEEPDVVVVGVDSQASPLPPLFSLRGERLCSGGTAVQAPRRGRPTAAGALRLGSFVGEVRTHSLYCHPDRTLGYDQTGFQKFTSTYVEGSAT
jgi:hypothetical protein